MVLNWWKYWFVVLCTVQLITGLKFLLEPQDAVSMVSQPYFWHCQAAESISPVIYRWRFGDADAPTSGNQVVYPNGTLLIREVKESSVGRYMCVIMSGSETIYSEAISLNLAAIDSSFTVNPRNMSVNVKSKVTLECSINSYPAPQITWYLRDIPVTMGTISMVTRILSVLNILSVSYSNEGNYSCLATNTMLNQNVSSSVAILTVQGQPEIIVPPQPIETPNGSIARFDCVVAGNPSPTLSWLYASSTGAQIEIKDGEKFKIYQNGSLFIGDVTEDLGGFYTCRAKNSQGEDTKAVLLTVTGPPLAPVFASTLTDQQVDEGDDVAFACLTTGNPTPDITWSKEHGTLPNRVIYPAANNMLINRVTVEDRGTYTCKAQNTEGSITGSLKLTIQASPSFIVTPVSVTVAEGSPVNLQCQAAGDPKPSISWKTPLTEKLSPSEELSGMVVDLNAGLTINSAELKHHGIYTCTATNSIGSKSVSASLQVEGPPEFTSSPVSQGAIEGDDVIKIKCRAAGFPKPSVTWYRDAVAEPVTTDRKYIITNEGDLHILNIEAKDAGLYICWVKNKYNTIHATATLTVIIPPTFTTPPQNQSIRLEDKVMLHCKAHGDPVPTQTWQKDGRSLVLENNMKLYPNNTLVFEAIKQHQVGEYVCVATNHGGEMMATARIFTADVPNFTNEPSNATVTQGQDVLISCRAISEAPPTMSWFISDSTGTRGVMVGKLESFRVYSTTEGDLVIKTSQLSDEVWYICLAVNKLGETVSSPIYVDVQVPPSITGTNSPQHASDQKKVTMSCDVAGDPVPVLSWRSPRNVLIDKTSSGYVMMANNLTIEAVTMATDGGNWKCIACNTISCKEEIVQLLIEGEPYITSILTSRNETYIRIECQTTGLPAPKLTYFIGNAAKIENTAGHIISGNRLYINVNNVQDIYQCTAQNIFGFNTRVMTKPGVPTFPRVTKPEARGITLTWSDGTISGLPVTKYNLEYKSDSSTKWVPGNLTLTDVSSVYMVIDLKPYTSYVFRVSITNVLGTGDYSDESVRVQTLADVPSKPLNVIVKDLIGQITVQFDQSKEFNGNKGDIRYDVELRYRRPGTTVYVRQGLVTLTTNQNLFVEFKNIDNGDYIVRLKSRNLVVATKSNVVEIPLTVKDKAPVFIPVIKSVISAGSNSIHLTWNLPVCEPCVPLVTGFVVILETSTEINGTKQTQHQVNKGLGNATISDLKEFTQYKIYLAAINHVGRGPLSEPKTITTLYAPFSQLAYSGSLYTTGELIAIIGGTVGLLLLLILLLFIYLHHRQLKKLGQSRYTRRNSSRFYLGHPNLLPKDSVSDKEDELYLHTENPMFEEPYREQENQTPASKIPPAKPKRTKRSVQPILSTLNQPEITITTPDGGRRQSSIVRQIIPDTPVDKTPVNLYPDPDYPVHQTIDYPDTYSHLESDYKSTLLYPSGSSSDKQSSIRDVTLSELEILSRLFSNIEMEEDNFENNSRDFDKPDVFYY